jgi:hypothetical protein
MIEGRDVPGYSSKGYTYIVVCWCIIDPFINVDAIISSGILMYEYPIEG